MKTADTLLIGIDFTHGEDGNDADVLIVGRKNPNQHVQIINAFQGSEARDLYEKLVTVKENDA